MHRALWFLLGLDFKASWRSTTGLLKSWKRLGLLLLMFALVGLMVYARSLQSEQMSGNRYGQGMPFWAFIYLSASWLAASADRGLVMRPAEIQFLLGGPFPHRDIISLHLIRLAMRSFFSALVLSLVGLVYMPGFLSGLLGLWLLLAVSLLVGMNVSLMARSAHGKILRIARRLLTVGVIVVTIMMVGQAIELLQQQGSVVQISAIAASAAQTPVGQLVLPPLAWMFQPLREANFIEDCLPLLPSRLIIVIALVGSIYLLGNDFGERSLVRTDLALARRQSALRSGSAGGISILSRRFSLPMPRFRAGGITAVAWWQSIPLLRILPRYLAFTLIVLGILIVVPAMVDASSMSGTSGVIWLAGLSLYGDFLLLLQLPVGFLGPSTQREMLKTLPGPTWRIVVGQLLGPLIPVGLIHLLTITLFNFLFPIPAIYLWITALALVPAAILIVANVNLLGIWGFVQPRALQQRDLLAAGRAMASVWLFGLMLVPASLLAALFGTLIEFSLEGLLPSMCGFILGAGLGCLLTAMLYVAWIARTFDRWQPAASDRADAEVEHDH